MDIDLEMTFVARFNKAELDVICWVLNFADEYLACQPEDRDGMLSDHLEHADNREKAILHEVANAFANPPSQWETGNGY